MSFFASFPGLSRRASSSVREKPKPSINPQTGMLGFDLLFSLAHLSALAAAGVPRAKLMQMTGALPVSTAPYFQEVERIASGMSYQYAEACRIVGEQVTHEEAKGLLLRLSGAMNTGESESDFLAGEAQIQAEAYGNVYERNLETLKKWTDAFTALIVSAALIVVVATVSTMIYDLGTTVVGGLVLTTMLIAVLGVWIIYRAAPREQRTLRGPPAARSQARVRSMMTMLLPAAFALGSLAMLVGLNFGYSMIVFGLTIFPIGVVARRLDRGVTRVDQDISTFLRVLGTTMSAIGTTAVVAMRRLDMRSMPSLAQGVRDLGTRLDARVSPRLSWDRFVDDTGSEIVSRSVRVFLDGTMLGGDPEEVGKRASLLGSKITQLRAKRLLVSETFTYLSMTMQVVISFLLIFIVEIVSGFNDLIAAAGLGSAGGADAALGSTLAFNLANLRFLQIAMVPVVLVLTIVNAVAPKVAAGDYALSIFYYLGISAVLGGGAFIAAPLLGHAIFGASSIGL